MIFYNMESNLFPIELELTTSTFEAGGYIYHVERNGRLSVARDRWLEKFSIFSLMGRQSSAILGEIKKAYEALNSGKPVDCGVLLHNLMQGAAEIGAKAAPLYYICTLFINREGEDRRTYSLELGEQKIADWENLDAFFFKQLALNYLQITNESWSSAVQSLTVNLADLNPLQEDRE